MKEPIMWDVAAAYAGGIVGVAAFWIAVVVALT